MHARPASPKGKPNGTTFEKRLRVALDAIQQPSGTGSAPEKIDKFDVKVNNDDLYKHKNLKLEVDRILADGTALKHFSFGEIEIPVKGGNISEDNPTIKKDFSKTISSAKDALLMKISSALENESYTVDELENLGKDIEEASLGGHFKVAIWKFVDLAQQPPVRAPELWQGYSAEVRENPVEFIERVYARWLQSGRMHRGALYNTDRKLYGAFNTWSHKHTLPDHIEDQLPTKKAFLKREMSKNKL